MSHDLDINANLNIDSAAAERSIADIAKKTQNAASKSVNATVVPAIKSIATFGFQVAAVGTAAVLAVKGVMQLQDTMLTLYRTINGTTRQIDLSIKAEKQRVDILKMQIDYIGTMYSMQNKANAAMIDADKIANDIERNRQKAINAAEQQAEKDIKQIQHEGQIAQRRNLHDVNLFIAGLVENWWKRPVDSETIGFKDVQGKQRTMTYDHTRGLGGSVIGGELTFDGVVKRTYNSLEQMKMMMQNFVDEIGVGFQELEQRRVAEREALLTNQTTQIDRSAQKQLVSRDIAQIMRDESERQRNRALSNMTAADAASYAVERQYIDELHAIQMKYVDEYEKARVEAAKTGKSEIDIVDKFRLDQQLADNKVLADARKSALLESIEANKKMQESIIAGFQGSANAVAELASNFENVINIANAFFRMIGNAKNAEEIRAAQMQRNDALRQAQLDHMNRLSIANASDRYVQQMQGQMRDEAEGRIGGAGNIAASDIAANSGFRTSMFDRMLSGNMNRIGVMSENRERLFSMYRARSQEMHNQQMMYLRNDEASRENRINVEYERSRAMGDLTAASTREAAMMSLRMNPRGSVALEAMFKEQQAREDARHREQQAVLKAIEGNTGQIVTDLASAYKQQASSQWSRAAVWL